MGTDVLSLFEQRCPHSPQQPLDIDTAFAQETTLLYQRNLPVRGLVISAQSRVRLWLPRRGLNRVISGTILSPVAMAPQLDNEIGNVGQAQRNVTRRRELCKTRRGR